MALQSNQPIKPITGMKNPANKYNNKGVSSMFKTGTLKMGSSNRIKSTKMKTNNGLNSRDLFKF